MKSPGVACIRNAISCSVISRAGWSDIYIARQRILALFNAILKRKPVKIGKPLHALENIPMHG